MLHKSLKNKTPWMFARYLAGYLIASIVKSTLCFYPIRTIILRFLGCKIKNHSRIYNISFLNFYKHGFKNLKIGDKVYIGPETMFDIADRVSIGSNTTIAARVLILTHMNVGYDDHPLKKHIPDKYASVNIGEGVFIGANTTIMPGITIGNNSIVGAMSLVLKNVESGTIVAGVPAKVIGRTEQMKEYSELKNKRLIIARITPAFFTVEAIFKEQNKFIADNEFEVHVITSPDQQAGSIAERDGFKHHSVNITRGINVIRDIKSIFLLTRLFKEIKPDIVHTHTSKGGFVGIIAATFAGVKWKIHSVAGWTADIRNKIVGTIILICEKITFKLSTHVIVNSQSLKNYLVKAGYLNPANAYLLGKGTSNGVDLAEFSRSEANVHQGKIIKKKFDIPEKDIVISYVGRIMIEKGVKELINSFISLKNNNIHLIMIGSLENESRKNLPETIKILIANNTHTHITGWVDNVSHYLAATDILVHPSHHEGMPNAILQGAAMELPCIASNVRGNRDAVLHKKTGFLYEPFNEAQLAKYLSLLINNESLRKEYGKQGRKYIEKEFDRKIVCQRLVEFYRNNCQLKG